MGAGTPEPIDYDKRILVALRRIIRSIDQYSRQLRTEYNITGPQLICLLYIVDEKPSTVSQISHAISLSASTVVGIVDRLEEKGLVRRERSSEDRRNVMVIATEEGRSLAKQAPSPLQDTLSKNLKIYSELEKNTIAMALEQIVNLMNVTHIDAAPILETGAIDKQNQGDS